MKLNAKQPNAAFMSTLLHVLVVFMKARYLFEHSGNYHMTWIEDNTNNPLTAQWIPISISMYSQSSVVILIALLFLNQLHLHWCRFYGSDNIIYLLFKKNKCFTNSNLFWKVQYCAPSLLRQASEHNLNLEPATLFTNRIKKNMAEKRKKTYNFTMIRRKLFFVSLYVLFGEATVVTAKRPNVERYFMTCHNPILTDEGCK